MPKVLVAYATTYGSTMEVAEAVGTALRETGTQVDVVRARDVKAVEGFDAVVVGAPLYYFRWHRDARRFATHFKKALADMPVAVFALGPFNDKAEEFEDARGQLDKVLDKLDWLEPRSITVFGGKFDPKVLRFPHNVPGLKNLPVNDIRDWDAIRTWATSLPQALGLRGDEEAK